MGRKTLTLVIVFLMVLMASALASYYFFDRPASSQASRPAATTTTAQRDANANRDQTAQANSGGGSSIPEMFGAGGSPQSTEPEGHWGARLILTTVRLALAALFVAVLAFRPRKSAKVFRRNLFVAQTQILVAVVASALMMIVGDSAARAFGIFAAASLVRFRTNIRDPKEITVLLVSLAVGLATGVGRWDLAALLSLFVLILLGALEYSESKMVFRAMELKVKTRNLMQTHEAVRSILTKHNFNSELRALNREDEDDPFGEVVFCIDIGPLDSTDVLSDEILTSDQSNNIDSIKWSQQKSGANVYQ